MRPEDREKTAFRTRFGSFEYTVLPMGLCNAPGTFMQLMNDSFRDMLDKCVLCFLDDILIFSRTEEEHLRHLRDGAARGCASSKLYVKLSKCEFMQREVGFLGPPHRGGWAARGAGQDRRRAAVAAAAQRHATCARSWAWPTSTAAS